MNTVTQSSGGQSLKESSTEGQTASTDTQSSGSKAKQSEVVKGKWINFEVFPVCKHFACFYNFFGHLLILNKLQ